MEFRYISPPFVCLFVSKKKEKDKISCIVFCACLLTVCVSFLCFFSTSLKYLTLSFWKCSIFTPALPFLLHKKKRKQKNYSINISSSSAYCCGCKSCNTTALISPAEMSVFFFCDLFLCFLKFLFIRV
jgi:hypothetical protein